MPEVSVPQAERTLALRIASAAVRSVWPELAARRRIGQDHRLVEREIELHIHALAQSMAADVLAKVEALTAVSETQPEESK